MDCNEVAQQVVDSAFHVHRGLGPGLLESVYEVVLRHELHKRGLKVECQKTIPIVYDGLQFMAGYRADLVVNDLLIVEIKSIEAILPVHRMQLPTYLRLAGKQLGLLINFNTPLIKDGISRVVNGLPEP